MIPWFEYSVFYLGPIPLRVWGFFVALGMVTALLILRKRGQRFGQDSEKLLDHAFRMIIYGVVFARVFHVIFYEPAFFFAHPIEILKIWHGGLSSYGGFFGALLVFYSYRHRWRASQVSLLKIADIFSFAGLFGWLVGRLGCVMIHDHLGRFSNLWFATLTSNGPRLEMSILEIMMLIPLAIVFFALRNKNLRDGTFLCALLFYYGATRFLLDFYRAIDLPTSDARYAGLTPAQYFSILFMAVGVYAFVRLKISRKV